MLNQLCDDCFCSLCGCEKPGTDSTGFSSGGVLVPADLLSSPCPSTGTSTLCGLAKKPKHTCDLILTEIVKPVNTCVFCPVNGN